MTDPRLLWAPSQQRAEGSELYRYQRWLTDSLGVATTGYTELWRWSVDHLDEFWASVWAYFDVLGTRGNGPVRRGTMPRVDWFPGASVNYAENMLRHASQRPADEAVVGLHERADREVLTWSELEGQVGALAAELRRSGVRPGDRVCAVLPHIPSTVVALLATTSIGAVWSLISPDFGLKAIRDRFSQIEPKVLITVDGYDFNGRFRDQSEHAAALRDALPTVEHHIVVDRPGDGQGDPGHDAVRFSDLVAHPMRPVFEPVRFGHPLWVLYSSGTTGTPKGIVHGHGGMTLEALKANGLQYDVGSADRSYFAASPAWVIWNLQVNTLMLGATVITYDGSPTFGTPARHLVNTAREQVTFFGTGAAVLSMIEQSGIVPNKGEDFSALRSVLSSGSPLPDSTWEWFYSDVTSEVRLGSDSGGTDVATGFIGTNPFDPVRRGELMGPYLGVAADAYNSDGVSVEGEVGEFVVTAPMPSMPVMFWNDPDGSRYVESYFTDYPGVWRHGDWVTKLPGGRFVIHGRSDSTINRGGVRMGSADICQVVDGLPEVQASMVIGAELDDGDYYMPLFVVPAPGEEVDDALRERIVRELRTHVSPRHVPDEIIAAPSVPRTKTGKLLEVPIKRVFQGAPPDIVDRAAAESPEVLEWYLTQAHEFARSRYRR